MTRVARQVAPISSLARCWVSQEEDVLNYLDRQLADWMKNLSESEAIFKREFYENADVCELDFRQHRGHRAGLISSGEFVAVGFHLFGEETGKTERVKASLSLIDQKIKSLLDILFSWHGPLAGQSDIPETFKQPAREIEEGKIVDLDI